MPDAFPASAPITRALVPEQHTRHSEPLRGGRPSGRRRCAHRTSRTGRTFRPLCVPAQPLPAAQSLAPGPAVPVPAGARRRWSRLRGRARRRHWSPLRRRPPPHVGRPGRRPARLLQRGGPAGGLEYSRPAQPSPLREPSGMTTRGGRRPSRTITPTGPLHEAAPWCRRRWCHHAILPCCSRAGRASDRPAGPRAPRVSARRA